MEPSAVMAERLLAQRDWLRELARGLVGENDADDLVQETLVAALEHAPRVAAPRAWLTTIARRLASNVRRTRGRRRRREAEAARPEALPSTDALVERVDTEQRLVRELLGLREPLRTTLLLRYHEGLRAEEIARRTGVPAGTVRWRTLQGLDELRERIAPAYGGREGLALALVPLARGGTGAVTATVVGGVLVGIQAKLAAGTAALLVMVAVGVGAWRLTQAVGGESKPATSAVVALAADRAEAVQAPADALVAPAVDAGRASVPSSLPRTSSRPRLRVLEFDGEPNARQQVKILSPAGASEPLRTDADGRITLTATGAHELLIERASAMAYRTSLEIIGGEQTLTLPEGAVLEGRVVVDGGAPRRPLELAVLDSADESLELATKMLTDGAGQFRLHGLAADQGYTIVLPPGHARAGLREYSSVDERVRFDVPRPERGLVLEVERFPSLCGRLLDADGLTPAAGALDCRFTWRNGTNMDAGARAGEDGRFELFVDEPWRRVDLEYWGNPGERGKASASFAIESVPDGELGELVLGGGRDVVLRVHDPDGRPIAGARTDLETKPTDENGEARIPDTTRDVLRVAARGYGVASVSFTASSDVVEVELSPTAELLVEVRARGGEPVGHAIVELRGDGSSESLFESDKGPPSFLGPDREGQMLSWGGREFHAQGMTDERGLMRFDMMRARRPIELCVVARGGAVLHEERLPPLAPVERRRVAIDLDVALVAVRGIVLDVGGRPVAAAQLEAPGRSWEPVSTDRQGRFAFEVLDVPEWSLTVSKDGLRSRTVAFAAVPREDLELVLEPARSLDVRVVDANGRALRGGRLTARLPDGSGGKEAREVGPGRFVLADLDDGPLELALLIGGARFRRSVNDEREVVLTVPAMGAIEITWSLPPAEASNWIAVDLATDAEGRVPLHADFHRTPQGTERFDPVLPGVYELVLKTSDDTGEVERARRTIVVRAGETTNVEL